MADQAVAPALALKEAPSTAPLKLDLDAVKGELATVMKEPSALPVNDPLRGKAKAAVAQLISITPDQYEQARQAVDSAGATLVPTGTSNRTKMLSAKLGEIKGRSEEEGDVAKALIQLRDEAAQLDPSDIDFSIGWFSRECGKVPFVGWRIKRYMNRFETGQGVIDGIIGSLQSGRATLENDNKILAQDQVSYRNKTIALRKQIEYLMAVDEELTAGIAGVSDPDHQQFLKEEVLFALRQRVQDLMESLTVEQQGVIASEVMIRNNRELIRGVNRGITVTTRALEIGVELAVSLAHQGLVLNVLEKLGATTGNIIAGNARRIKQQGVQIQTMASSPMLESKKLAQSFGIMISALDDISQFRQNALPVMAQSILELDQSAKAGEEAIRRMEQGNKVAAQYKLIDLDAAAAAQAA